MSVDLCAKLLTERKNIPYLRRALNEVCCEWNINHDQIVAVVTDGGANIKGAVREEFGVLKHISCIAHLINCIGQDCIGLHSVHTYQVPSETEAVREIPDNEEELDSTEIEVEEIAVERPGSEKELLKNCL